MVTIFSTPKPFRRNIATIQRNALRSWTLLHPDLEVILFGDEEGAAEAARELGIRHEPQVRRNDLGTVYVASLFDRAQEIARHDLLCYVNCDILLMADFLEALERVRRWQKVFLMIGQRWDTNVSEVWDFTQQDWQQRLRALAMREGRQRPPQWIDYFLFSRGLFHLKIPSLVIGRPGWDNWMVWHARASGARVVDASPLVLAVHQNHDHSHHPGGEEGFWHGEEAQRNYSLLGGGKHFYTIENATHRLTPDGFRRNYRHWLVLGKRATFAGASRVWFTLLRMTRPIRHRVGLRQKTISAFFARKR